MKQRICACFFGLMLFVACNKKEPAKTDEAVSKMAVQSECGREIITDKPVKAGETGIILPVGTKLCLTKDNLEVRVTLPDGYAFLSKEEQKTLPIYGTYACNCSAMGTACMVFYADGWGFGCLQSTCTGSCTGKFTYKGYSLDKVVSTSNKTDFFKLPEISKLIEQQCNNAGSTAGDFVKLSVYGVSFFMVTNEAKFLQTASCDCEGTKACTLRSLGIAGTKIYYCEGPCNGCELTVK